MECMTEMPTSAEPDKRLPENLYTDQAVAACNSGDIAAGDVAAALGSVVDAAEKM